MSGLALLLVVISAPAALAAAPEVVSGSVTVPFINACTGEAEGVTSDFTNRVISTNGAFVQVIDSTITTDTGGVGRATNTIVVNPNNAIGPINIVVDYPDGSRQKVLLLVEGDLVRGGELLFVNAVCVQEA